MQAENGITGRCHSTGITTPTILMPSQVVSAAINVVDASVHPVSLCSEVSLQLLCRSTGFLVCLAQYRHSIALHSSVPDAEERWDNKITDILSLPAITILWPPPPSTHTHTHTHSTLPLDVPQQPLPPRFNIHTYSNSLRHTTSEVGGGGLK